MNGSNFGAFSEGLMGGMKMAKAYDGKTAKKVEPEEPGAKTEDYSGDLSGFEATPTGSVGAEAAAPKPESEDGGVWGTLSGIVDGLAGSDAIKGTAFGAIAGGGLGDTIGGKLLGGGLSKGLGGTIMGKIGGGKLLSGGLLGGLFK